ncbi:MAG TPA: bestrophin family ion channel [Leptolyngbyaceae cyanobacterium]
MGKKMMWPQLFLKISKSVIPVILPWVLLYSGYSFLVSLLYFFALPITFFEKDNPITRAVLIFNIGLPVLLVFRTITSYRRFWEGYNLWEALVDTVHNLTRDIWIGVKEQSSKDRLEKEATLRLIVAFVVAIKLHIRAEPVNDELKSLMSENQYFRVKFTNYHPLQIAFWIGDYLQEQYNHNCLDIHQLTALHKLMDRLVDIWCECELILKTTLPSLSTLILRNLLFIYCLILPLEIVKYFTFFTSTIMTFVSFLLLVIEQIGSETEEPFGHKPNNPPLDVICNTILRNVEDLLALAPIKDDFQ